MREGGVFWVRGASETVDVGWGRGAGEGLFNEGHDKMDDDDDETEEGKALTGDEVSSGGSTSSASDDTLPLGKEGEQGGVSIWIPSPREEDRLFLAMELAVGFM